MKNILRILIILVLTITLASCNKWLDIKPKTQADREAFYESEDGFKNAIVGCYVKMKQRALYGEYLSMTMIEFMAQHWSAIPDPSSDKKYRDCMINAKKFDYTNLVLKGNIQNVYAGLYNVIVQANDILAYLETNGSIIRDPKLRDMIKGEALAIRAFCHFDILRFFGEMPNGSGSAVALPYAEKASRESVPTYGFKQFSDLVIRDYTEAAKLLKDSDPLVEYSFAKLDAPQSAILDGIIDSDAYAYRRMRINYFALKSLMARAYLYFGNKDQAYQCAKEVIDAKYEDGKSVITLQSSEYDFTNGDYALPNDALFTMNIYNITSYTDNLFRKQEVLTIGSEPNMLDVEIFAGQTTDNRKNLWFQIVDASSVNQISIKKYWQTKDLDGKDESPTNAVTNRQLVPIMRLAEVYFIAIESAPNEAESNLLFKRFKASKSLLYDDLSGDALQQEIVNEYRREFFAEGQMFYTYKRLGSENMLWRKEPVSALEYIVPVPDTEINR